MRNKFLEDFIREAKPSEELINKYTMKIPELLLEIWKQYGFGNTLNGYLKIVNPDLFQAILKNVYVRNESAIVLFVTSMGDFIVWEDNKYLILLNFRRGRIKGISSGFKFFFSDLEDEAFYQDTLDWLPYPEAVGKLGKPKYDECFGYVPILGLGGLEKVENLSKVKLIEHIYLINQLMGTIK
ncbi:MAG TPA: hypothetical protein DDW50_10500 [Firmicutes bacterium]|nr:hypothetical protein [Bacillota bacterium]